MAIIITCVKLSKNKVSVKEVVQVQVGIMNSLEEPVTYRLPFKLGSRKGGAK